MDYNEARRELLRVVSEVSKRVVDRREVAEVLMMCLLAGENPLLIGPPGCAKSTVVTLLSSAFGEDPFVLSGHANLGINDVFGPTSLAAAKNDEYRRAVENFLPGKSFAVLDEVTRFSESIRHSLFQVMNEGTFNSNGEQLLAKTLLVMGTDNSLQKATQDAAFWDRWMVRMMVDYVATPAARRKMLEAAAGAKLPPITSTLTVEDIRELRGIISEIPVSREIFDELEAMRMSLNALGVVISDRRLTKVFPLLKASAFLMGEEEVMPHHLPSVLTHTFWQKPEQIPELVKLLKRYDNPVNLLKKELEQAFDLINRMDEGQRFKAYQQFSQRLAKERVEALRKVATVTGNRKVELESLVAWLTRKDAAVKKRAMDESGF